MKSSNELLSQLLTKMKKGHPSLKESYGSPSRGVAAPMNEAFVIDQAKYDALVKEDPRSAEILRPFVEANDIKRWRVEPRGLWLIFTPKGKLDINDYPAVKRHLLPFREQLENRAAGQQWFELEEAQSAIAQTMAEPKIGFSGMADQPSFHMDVTGTFFGEDSSFISSADYYLAGLLNSATYRLLLTAGMPDGSNELQIQHIGSLPVPDAGGFQRGDIGRYADICHRKVKDRLDLIAHFRGMTAHNLSSGGAGSTLSDKLTSWFFLDFATFREEVINTFGQDIPQDDLELWENYLEQEKQQVMKINAEIVNAEYQIEKVIYEIFGLTEDEIALIERT